jgi:hypothetical protein
VQLETFKNRYKILQASLAEDFLKNPDLVGIVNFKILPNIIE